MKKFNLLSYRNGSKSVINNFFGKSKKEAIEYFNTYHFILFKTSINLDADGFQRDGLSMYYVKESVD